MKAEERSQVEAKVGLICQKIQTRGGIENMKKISIVALISILFCVLSVSVMASDIMDPQIPESWFEAPKLASEVGITEFDESPMLADRVASGELEAVAERLPKDPPVVEPYGEIGKYGGTAEVWGTALNFGGDVRYLAPPDAAGRVTPDGADIVPYYLESWEFSDQGRVLTLKLREGMKWSDGHLFTSDDYLFWWDHIAHNTELTNVPPEEQTPVATLNATAPDKYTVVYEYNVPNPRRDDFGFQNEFGFGVTPPAHFLKQFHPDFVDLKELEAKAAELGLNSWVDYFNRMRNDSEVHPEFEQQKPTLRPFVAVERTNSTLTFERNPYYPFVDTEGNQLPYIDRAVVSLANSREVAALKMATGEGVIGGRFTTQQDLALYKKNEKAEGYKTRIFQKAYGSDCGIQLNLSHEDPAMRELFLDVRFRRALSVAIDRENINKKLYFGLAVPMQASVPPTSKFYKDEYGQAYADFDLEQAEQLLDEIGMVDKDGNGFRERPDGQAFRPTLIYSKDFFDPTPALELIKNSWSKVGIDFNMKEVDRALLDQARAANDFDISVWVIDNITDVGLGDPWHIAKMFAPGPGSVPYSPWPDFINWIQTKGEEGIEPPEEIKYLRKLADKLATDPDPAERDKAAVELIELQAENLWSIGTVALPPQPVMVSNKLKNVPDRGLWDWSMRYMSPYYPVQFYLDD